MSRITVNGTTFEVEGNNIVVNNGRVMVDGKAITTVPDVTIKFEGDLANLVCHNCEINGNVGGNIDCHNIVCGKVAGNISAHNIVAN